MIYTAIDTFYLTDEQLNNSPSRKDGIDEETEASLRVYGCDLIQESGILLRLPQAVMATGQVLFHRFYCKKSFARFDVKRVAASSVWLASKLEESPRRAKHILAVFHRMECRRENLPIGHLDYFSTYSELKAELVRAERHLLKEMGFICHVEHPHKFISNYLATLGTPPELRQDAWNLANDSLRTTVCVRFKSEVVACGVVYAAARRSGVPLPENPPWWKVFDADKASIDEVCRALAHLYSRPRAKYIPVCKEPVSFTTSNKSRDSQAQRVPKEGLLSTPAANSNSSAAKSASEALGKGSDGSKDGHLKQASDNLKGSEKSADESRDAPINGESGGEAMTKSKAESRMETSRERSRESRDRERDRERDRDREKQKSRDRERGRDSDRERDDTERDRDKVKGHRSRERLKDSGGHSDKSRHHSSRDRDRDRDYYMYKDRHRRH